MAPTPLLYDAPGFGVGEVWLDEEGRVFYAELPRPRAVDRPFRRHALTRRLTAFFQGGRDDFSDVELDHPDGFYGDCVRALRAVGPGDIVTYGELAALAGRPGAARAAGTFCGRCDLSPFVPTHRVISAGGIGSYGSLGIDYKRRLLRLEGVDL